MGKLKHLQAGWAGLLLGLFGLAACACAEVAVPDRPVIFNAPASSRPGDVVGLQGAFFGDAPVVTLKGTTTQGDVSLPLLNTFGGGWLSFKIPKDAPAALVVTVRNGLASSDAVALNAARAYHLDALHIAPDGALRVFGRNLLVAGFAPALAVNGMAAHVDLSASDEHMLVATAPHGLRPNSAATITVDNGNGTGPSTLDRSIAVVPGGADVLGLGVGWGGGFASIAAREVVLGGDGQALCNGQANDTPAVQAAMDQLANTGGGVLKLPAGVCRFATSLVLKSRVVLQGRGKDETRIRYEASYPLWGRKLDLAGVSDLTLQSTRAGMESTLLQDSTRVFLKNIRFELGGGLHMFLTGNTDFVVMGSDITQPNNPGLNGVYSLGNAGGLVFVNNTTRFAHGAPSFSHVHDAYLANNRFVRDARQRVKAGDVVHSMTLDFAHRVAVMRNTFEVMGGPIGDKFRNDGESILTEGGGGSRTENMGAVASATRLSLSAPTLAQSARAAPDGKLPENFGVAIVGGTGAGQARRVTSLSGTTLTVDQAWDQLPDASSRYSTFVWGLEKSVIKGNTLKDNPRGIWLYQTAVRDVDIVNNQISEGGGIYLRTAQGSKYQLFTPMYGVRIADNQISNTRGEWRSYISVMFVRMDEYDFGVGTIGIEVRNNRMVANTPNLMQPQEESGGAEGFINRMHTEGQTQGRALTQTRLLGTVLQDNQCSGCNIGVLVRDGAQATVQDGNVNLTKALETVEVTRP